MNRDRTQAVLTKVICHEIAMPLRAAESQGALTSSSSVLVESVLRALLGGNGPRQLFFIETIVAPRNVPIIHLIRNAEIVERNQEPLANPTGDIASINQVLPAKGQQITSVSSLGCRG